MYFIMNYVTLSNDLITDIVTDLEHPMFARHQDFLAHMVENDVTRFTHETKKKYNFEYVLQQCLEKGHFPLFKDIVKHTPINESFLMTIMKSQRADMLEYLISIQDIEQYFPRLLNHCLKNTEWTMLPTILHHASGVEPIFHEYLQFHCVHGNKEIIKSLLDCAEIKNHIHWNNRYSFNKDYETCLGAAIFSGHLGLTKILIKPIKDINIFQPEFILSFKHHRENLKKTQEIINLFLFDKSMTINSDIEAQVMNNYGQESLNLLKQTTLKRNGFLRIEGKFTDNNYQLI